MISLVAISLATITLDYRQGANGPLESVGRTAFAVITPLQDAVSHLIRPVGNFFSALGHLPSLQKQNNDLKAQLAEAKSALARQAIDQQQAAELAQLFKVAQTLGATPYVGATVIGSSVSNFEWSVTIDKGSSDGVQAGDPVISPYGLVGHVVRTTPYSADVQEILDPNSQVAAVTETNPPVTGLVQGQGENDLKMELVGQTSTVPANATVFTKPYQQGNISALYPGGIIIGRVSQVLPVPGSLDKVVTVRPTVDFATLDLVMVVQSTSSG